MTTLQIILLLVIFAIVTAETFLLWKCQRREKTFTQHSSIHHYTEVKRDDDDDRFRLAPLVSLDEEYLNMFSNPPMDKAARRWKSAYLRDAYHERIRQIVNALNVDDVNISSYVDMVLTDHFMRYEAQIDCLLHNCYRDTCKQEKQWQPS